MIWMMIGALGCAPEPSDRDGTAISARYAEGSPEALGLQAFLNDESTTAELLDDDVRLDSRAATNLIAHRDGADGVLGTSDDDLFGTIAEIDAIKYVGDSALEKLFTYAIDNGWVAEDGIEQVIEGVSFTAAEAEATLALANTASEAVLDDDVRLDRRAAANIVADRPLADLAALGAVSYVGGSALEKLKAYAAANPIVEDDRADENESCATAADCKDGLVCLGEYAWGSGGWCVPEDVAGEFSAAPGAAIPDNDATGTSSTVEVTGLATVSVDIVVTLDVTHPRPEDLAVTLSNPLGTEASVVSGAATISGDHIVRGIPSDEDANGDWTLKVTDTASGQRGTLGGWSVYIISTYD